jgi:predicted ribosome quality control (RQC) complex YloA/Tae2 family protein
VTIPDPADTSRSLEFELDPRLNAQANAARYFKRAAKAERALEEIPPRIAATEREIEAAGAAIAAVAAALECGSASEPLDEAATRALEAGVRLLPPGLRAELEPAGPAPRVTLGNVASGAARAPSSRLQPKRFKSAEGWDVLIGRNNEGNDYLTHKLARPEDYWFHVHGAPGSHVVLRRGKGKDEPSKQTIQEVASWAAFFSQARTAGKVPVIVTQKKYVRKPRKAPPGLALCEREKTIIVRPVEPKLEMPAEAEEAP